MKKLLISIIICSCLILIIGCSKDKKTNSNSVDSNSTNNVSNSDNSKNSKFVEVKYRGTYICLDEASFQITENELFAHVNREGSMADGMHLGQVSVFTVGDELWAVDYSGSRLAGRFTDANTLIPTENILLGNYKGMEFKKQ